MVELRISVADAAGAWALMRRLTELFDQGSIQTLAAPVGVSR
jgi:hypothetical protein